MTGAPTGPDPLVDQRPMSPDAPDVAALVGELTLLKRRYDGLRSAHQRLTLQGMATCRTYAGGDKAEAAKLWREPPPELEIWLGPYTAALEPLDLAIAEQEKLLGRLAGKLPVAGWAAGIRGLSPRFLAMIVGECGIGPGQFRTVAGLWKRMGLAVINGQRQRKVAGDAAIEHGYVGRRRALMWNVGESMIKQQVRKSEDGETRHGIGDYGTLYLERKAYETARLASEATEDKPVRPIVAHNRAKRYMEKRLLRELWKAWRAATRIESDEGPLPVRNPSTSRPSPDAGPDEGGSP